MLSLQALATEGGGSNYLPGFYGDFQIGSMPGQGFYLSNLFSGYQDHKASIGNLLEMPGLLYVSETQFLGGNFAAGIWPALMVTKDHGGSRSQDRFALGDPYIMPALLSWDFGMLKALIFEGIVAPAGYYEKNHLNTGRNVWTFDHNLSVTLDLPLHSELSMNIGYMNNTKNPATDYITGDEFHFDYLLGHYLQSDIAVGIVGSYYRQVTADQGPANSIAKEFTAANTIGPVIMFSPKIGNKSITMSLKWLHEFDVQGRLRQDYIIWRAFMPFEF